MENGVRERVVGAAVRVVSPGNWDEEGFGGGREMISMPSSFVAWIARGGGGGRSGVTQ